MSANGKTSVITSPLGPVGNVEGALVAEHRAAGNCQPRP